MEDNWERLKQGSEKHVIEDNYNIDNNSSYLLFFSLFFVIIILIIILYFKFSKK